MKSCCDAKHYQTKAALQAFVNGAFAADDLAKAGHPRVWGNGIPIKYARVLIPRSEL